MSVQLCAGFLSAQDSAPSLLPTPLQAGALRHSAPSLMIHAGRRLQASLTSLRGWSGVLPPLTSLCRAPLCAAGEEGRRPRN